MARLLILCGLPGSGKSGFVAELGLTPGRIFCPDKVLSQEGDYDTAPDSVAQAWRLEYKRFGFAVTRVQGYGDEVVLLWDAMFPTTISRAALINFAGGAGLKVEILYFDTPLDACLRRNAKRPRDRRIPEEKIRSWAKTFEEPRAYEGSVLDDFTIVRITPANFRRKADEYYAVIHPVTVKRAGAA